MNSKRKGTAGENELSALLRAAGIRAYRNDQIYRGGAGNPDVFVEIQGIKLHVEVKRAEKLNIHTAMAQAIRDAQGGSIPIVAHRRNREKWLITVPLESMLSLIQTEGGETE